MDYSKCPCYTCLVAVMCVGKEPTPEEHQRMIEEMEEYEKEHGCQAFLHNNVTYTDDFEIPELEAQYNCPMYKDWKGLTSTEELELEYVGIEVPQMKLLGEKEIGFHKRQNRKIC